MRDNLSDLEFDLLMLVAPVLRKLAYAEGKVGTLALMTRSAAAASPHGNGSRTTPTRHCAELEACSDEELAERFARPLTFGTAGSAGPDARRARAG